MKRGGAGHLPLHGIDEQHSERASECSATLGRDCWEPEKSSSTRLACSRSNSRNFTSHTLHLTDVSVHGARPRWGQQMSLLLPPPRRRPDQTRPDQTDQTKPNQTDSRLPSPRGMNIPSCPNNQPGRGLSVLLAWGFASYRIALSFCPKRLPSRSQHAHGLHPPPGSTCLDVTSRDAILKIKNRIQYNKTQ
jgi:hypothetical protein